MLVLLANAIVEAWPADQRLEFLHAPFARGAEPPPLKSAYYARLADLRLPERVHFAAGFVHENRSPADLVAMRDRIDWLVGRQIDVAASCGLGQRDRERALRNIELSRHVADAD